MSESHQATGVVTGRQNRHGAGPIQTDRYTELEILEFNRIHDSRMGWSEQHRSIYTNINRRPETTHLPAKDVWRERV